MEKILWIVVELSYTGTWVIAAVMLLRCLLHRLPKKFSYVLWIIPGIRLLFPISFTGFWGLIENWKGEEDTLLIHQAVKAVQDTIKIGKQMDGVKWSSFAVAQTEGTALSVSKLIAVLWVVGMLLLVGHGVLSVFRLKKRLQISMKWKENIYFTDGILTPFVFMGFPDKIYLPSELAKEECRYILLHEQFHIKRRDSFFKLLACLILCIHWFNPVVWLGVYFFNRDMEMSCDEAVAEKLDKKGKQEYAKELLRFSVNQKQRLLFSVRFGEKGVKRRIMNLFEKKSKTKGAFVLGTVLVIMAGVILLPDFLGQDLANTASGETKAEKTAKERLEGLLEEKDGEEGREYGYPIKVYQYEESGKVIKVYEAGHAESDFE